MKDMVGMLLLLACIIMFVVGASLFITGICDEVDRVEKSNGFEVVGGEYELVKVVDEVGREYYVDKEGSIYDLENKMALDLTQPKQEPETHKWVLNNQTGEYDEVL